MRLSQRVVLQYIRTKFKLLSSISKKKAGARAFELFCTPQSRNKKKLPKIFEKGERLQFEMEAVVIRGWRFNHPAEKRVLILHGFESSGINFDVYVRLLLKKGYEVLIFDAPAHGVSGGRKITAPLYKRMILEIDRLYGPVTSFIAHSFGGLAISLALEEISHTADYRLVLIAPATETTSAIDSFFKFLRLDPGIRPEFEKIIVKTGGVSTAWYSIKRAMKHIRAKTLWVHDEEDQTTPFSDVLNVKAENYPHIEFVFTKGLGHRRIYKDNKVTRSAVDFL